MYIHIYIYIETHLGIKIMTWSAHIIVRASNHKVCIMHWNPKEGASEVLRHAMKRSFWSTLTSVGDAPQLTSADLQLKPFDF